MSITVRWLWPALIAAGAGAALLVWGLGIHWLLAVIGSSSAATFLYYGYDKLAAKRGWRRIPERTLHVLSLLGGAPGALLGQQTFRHKTIKSSFQVVFWLIVVAQLTLAAAVIYWAQPPAESA